jgi:ribosomal-protein-alanine N-acetyltransferase
MVDSAAACVRGRGIGHLVVRLVPADLRLLDAAVESDEALAAALGMPVAPGWNGFPEALRHVRDSVAANPAAVEWGTRFFVDSRAEGELMVGWGGFKGPPAGDGEVELGYEIAPSERGRGLASAAVEEMLRVARAAPEVSSVIAHTLAERNTSVRVLEKTGFTREAEIEDSDDGPVWRFRTRGSLLPPWEGGRSSHPTGGSGRSDASGSRGACGDAGSQARTSTSAWATSTSISARSPSCWRSCSSRSS